MSFADSTSPMFFFDVLERVDGLEDLSSFDDIFSAMETVSESPSQQLEEETITFLTGRNKTIQMTPKDFIATYMERIDSSTLPEDDHLCPCCHIKYGDPTSDEVDSSEQPVKTGCGHVFGEQCLASWMVNNSCPVCRAPLFKVPNASLYDSVYGTSPSIPDFTTAVHWVSNIHRELPRLTDVVENVVESSEIRLNEVREQIERLRAGPS